MPVEDIGLDVIQAPRTTSSNRFIRWRQAGSNFQKRCGQPLGDEGPPVELIDEFYSLMAFPRLVPKAGKLSTRSHSSRETTCV
jgi:hypothetical protein